MDRRFGENDPSMAPEERMLERFTKERQRASRSSAFNLEDEDELTHYGQSLSALDDFDGTGLALEDEEEDRGMYIGSGQRLQQRLKNVVIGQIDAQTVQKDHFGGFEDEDEDAGQDEVCRRAWT